MIQYVFLGAAAVAFIILIVASTVYMKTKKSNNPHSKETSPIEEKFPSLNPKPNPNPQKLSVKDVLIQKMREGTIEYKTFQGRGKPPIVIDGVPFEYIRDKETPTSDFKLDEPVVEYDASKDPDRILTKSKEKEESLVATAAEKMGIKTEGKKIGEILKEMIQFAEKN